MANKGLSMRKVREVLRLHYAAGLSTRAIARSLKVSPATVGKYIRRAEEQGLSWPLPEPLDDAALERRLFPAPVLSATQRPLPQWSEVHRELRQPDVTLALVWQEYKAAHPGGLQYSWFCDQYRAWASKLDVVMRQEHRAGEKLFVDYAGRTVRGGGPPHRGATPSAGVRRGARSVELHVCRGDMDADAAGLDRVARARIRVSWRLQRTGHSR